LSSSSGSLKEATAQVVGHFPNASGLPAVHDLPNNAIALIDFYWRHQMFSEELYRRIRDNHTDDELDFPSEECAALLREMRDEMGPFYSYNIYELRNDHEAMTGNSNGTGTGYPAGYEAAFAEWVDQVAVRKALNIDEIYPKDWAWDESRMDPATGDEAREWYPFGHEIWLRDGPDKGHADPRHNPQDHPHWDAAQRAVDMRPLYLELAQRLRVVIYSGDVDAQVPPPGSERWVRGLGLAEEERWRPWVVGGIVAGGVTAYDVPDAADGAGISFVTLRGAGHGVPQHRPQATLAMLGAMVAGEPLPRLPPSQGRL
jgi:hypothetical protein